MSGWLNVVRLFFAAALLVLLFGMFFPPYGEPRGVRYKIQCISNLKQIGTAMLIYVDDHDSRFPASDWIDAVMPHAKGNEELFTCPEVNVLKQKWGFAMNLELMGSSAKKIVDPSTKPMLFEIDALARNVVANLKARNLDRHKRQGSAGSVICRADSSTKFIRADTPLPE